MGDSVKQEVDEHLKKYQEMQQDIGVISQQRNKLYQQANENGMVKQELEYLEAGSVVYKMIGPVLMQQDLEEAKQNVDKRIEFIQGEMGKVEKNLEQKQKEASEIADKIVNAQRAMQAKAAEEAQKAAAEAMRS